MLSQAALYGQLLKQLSLPNKPSDATVLWLPVTPHKHHLCPVTLHLNLVISTGPCPNTTTAHVYRLSLTYEVHVRASLLHSPPEITLLNS